MLKQDRYCANCGFDRKDKTILMCPKCGCTWWTNDSKVLRWTEDW
jgi:predicted Zn-ribbon and HTH transcriptional regulator